MYPIGKVWLNVCSQADDGKSNAGDMQGRGQCREENNEKDMYLDIYIYIYMVPPVPMKKVDFRGGGGVPYIYIYIYIYMVPLQNWPQNSRFHKGYKTPCILLKSDKR